jgi:hypothetical protein
MGKEKYSDAAKRVSDQYNLHRIAAPYEAIGKWFAVKLHDGDSDQVLYDSKIDAVTHQKHNEQYYAFVQIGPWNMTPKDAETFLAMHRRMYDRGLHMADPDSNSGGRDVIKRVGQEDQYNQLRSMFVGDRSPSNIRYGQGSNN